MCFFIQHQIPLILLIQEGRLVTFPFPIFRFQGSISVENNMKRVFLLFSERKNKNVLRTSPPVSENDKKSSSKNNFKKRARGMKTWRVRKWTNTAFMSLSYPSVSSERTSFAKTEPYTNLRTTEMKLPPSLGDRYRRLRSWTGMFFK